METKSQVHFVLSNLHLLIQASSSVIDTTLVMMSSTMKTVLTMIRNMMMARMKRLRGSLLLRILILANEVD